MEKQTTTLLTSNYDFRQSELLMEILSELQWAHREIKTQQIGKKESVLLNAALEHIQKAQELIKTQIIPEEFYRKIRLENTIGALISTYTNTSDVDAVRALKTLATYLKLEIKNNV